MVGEERVIQVWVHLFPTDIGGRSTPVNTKYRPHLRTRDDDEYLGVEFVSPSEIVPGASARADARLPYDVDYSSLVPGAVFEILEGDHIVGVGRVLGKAR